MKYLLGLAAATLLVTGSVYAETIAEREESLLIRAENFKSHPLHEYLIPEGYSALSLILINVDRRCRTEPEINSDECQAQREAAAEQLKGYGYKDAEEDDFKEDALWVLAADLKDIYNAKQNVIQDKIHELTAEQRKKQSAIQSEISARRDIGIQERMELIKVEKSKVKSKELENLKVLYSEMQKRPMELRKQLANNGKQ